MKLVGLISAETLSGSVLFHVKIVPVRLLFNVLLTSSPLQIDIVLWESWVN